ncbi:ATP-binding protein [Sulfurimonas indica]|uniref:ATP-binding protein n=1 Tax=Sulfurimonas indica TaxID=2508707 RepID=UPI0012649DBA|nr:ATP-binding protein [Sulfurimonas indica]
MSVKTNLHGRLRNTPLPVNQGLMPLFEAVVNSIHSIEEYGEKNGRNIRDRSIVIDIARKTQTVADLDDTKTKRGVNAQSEITGFKITDNGIGFNDDNYQSFETLDSEYKIDKGCRGVGRLLWLKAFDTVSVVSIFKNHRKMTKRTFTFDAHSGVSDPIDETVSNSEIKTIVTLNGFHKDYRKASSKTTYKIAESLLEHCLWYFVRERGVPKIVIRDKEESISLDDLYEEYMTASAVPDSITIKEQKFDLIHIKSKPSSNKVHSISYIAASRFVKEESIEKSIPGLYGKLNDGTNDFIYKCYISSEFLDERVRPERTGLDIVDNSEGLISEFEISYKDIKEAVLKKTEKFLKSYLEDNLNASKERVNNFVETKAPRYRPIMSRIPENKLNVDPNISDKDLDLILHKYLYEIEKDVIDRGHSIMVPEAHEDSEEYQKRLQNYLGDVEDIKKSDLANYVSHRKVILDLLEASIQRREDGKYAREELIHDLIMPMQKESNELRFDEMNLWLLDEKLAFHNYLASDKTLNSMSITDSKSTKEPDLLALHVRDNPILVSEDNNSPLASMVVVEIKRPMRNNMKSGEKDDPIEQALGYLNRIRNGKVTTAQGRHIPNANRLPGFCYIVADLTDTLVYRCKMSNLTPTDDGMGYFGFNKEFEAYIEVISFDKLVQSAKERNRAFFDKLGLPAT